METREIRNYFIRVEDARPLILHQLDSSPTAEQMQQQGLSHWALRNDRPDDFPALLIHIYYSGRLLSDEARGGVNAAVADYMDKLLAEPDANVDGDEEF